MTPVTFPEAKPGGCIASLELGGERWLGGVVIASGCPARGWCVCISELMGARGIARGIASSANGGDGGAHEVYIDTLAC